MKKSVKAPGRWEDAEDRALRVCVRAGMSPTEAAARLNRLERSVVTRAIVLKAPFPVTA